MTTRSHKYCGSANRTVRGSIPKHHDQLWGGHLSLPDPPSPRTGLRILLSLVGLLRDDNLELTHLGALRPSSTLAVNRPPAIDLGAPVLRTQEGSLRTQSNEVLVVVRRVGVSRTGLQDLRVTIDQAVDVVPPPR